MRTKIISILFEQLGITKKDDITRDLKPNQIKKNSRNMAKIIAVIDTTINSFSENIPKEYSYITWAIKLHNIGSSNPTGNYMFKVNNRNTKTRCKICSKLTIKTPGGHPWCSSGVFIVDFEHVSHLALVLLLITLNR